MAEGKNFTITVPKVGVGLQGLTFSLLIWLGGQANAFVQQLTEGFDGLTERVERLESAVANVGVDPDARAKARALQVDLEELREENFEQDERILKLEECLRKGRRKCP